MTKIKIIDLFAGPGGLGEGFASFKTVDGSFPFEIVASVEKEASAHQTLQLRSFFRKFQETEVPKEYYEYVSGNGISKKELFDQFPEQSAAAIAETLDRPTALGVDNDSIHQRIDSDLKDYAGLKLVIGGPPCQAYSLVGRSRNKGNSQYVAEKDPRHFLYKEYLRILHLVQPHVFVMENVKGILSSKIEGHHIFPQILADLKNPGKALDLGSNANYKIYSLVVPAEDPENPEYKDFRDFIIRAEQYGIPQARHRVILLGVRTDIEGKPGVLSESPKVNVEDVIGHLPKLRSGVSKVKDSEANWYSVVESIKQSLVQILQTAQSETLAEHIQNWSGFHQNLGRGSPYIPVKESSQLGGDLGMWLVDHKLKGILNHESRGHMRSDLSRYLFCSHFAMQAKSSENPSPKAKDFPLALAPKHANWNSGKFADRFRVQAKGRYSTTVTSHISKDGHYFIHYDPAQCRSLTVREAARLQTFPDNYFFEGNKTQQYVQVGNAVPSFLANKTAQIVYELLMNIPAI